MLVAEGLRAAHPGAETFESSPLDLTLRPGEWLGVAGGNGSGKTALLLTLAGLAPARGGRVTIDGIDATDARARAQVGVVFQEPETQFVTDRVARELAFPLENLGLARADIDARVRELLAAFDLAQLADAPPDRLSGGEMQRVALAAAAATRPRYYLMDEPASFLDPESRTRLLAWTRERIERDGAAVLWTECDPAACEGADRVLTLPGAAGEIPGAPLADPVPGPPLWTGRGLALTRRRDGGPARRLWGGLDLDIRGGERIALVGPNGSGKTALLDTLAGWIRPTEGSLESPAPERVGFLAQFPEYQLFAPTVLEDVRFGAARRKHARGEAADSRARAALREAGLEPSPYEERDPAALSLGEKRRVALAGVLATEPLALLLDEPTAGLDPAGTAALVRALSESSGRGTALVVATHDPRVAARLGARTVRLGTP